MSGAPNPEDWFAPSGALPIIVPATLGDVAADDTTGSEFAGPETSEPPAVDDETEPEFGEPYHSFEAEAEASATGPEIFEPDVEIETVEAEIVGEPVRYLDYDIEARPRDGRRPVMAGR